MPSTKYIVLSTPQSTKGPFAQVCGIYSSLEEANNHAKKLLSEEFGNYTVDYDKAGCLIMPPEKPAARGPAKKPTMKVAVVTYQLDSPGEQIEGPNVIIGQASAASKEGTISTAPSSSFTKTITLYHFTVTYGRCDRSGDTVYEKIKEEKYFLAKRKALEHFHVVSIKNGSGYDDETTEEWVKHYSEDDRLPEWDNWGDGYLYEGTELKIETKPFDIIFRSSGPLKKGFVETAKSQFKVKDWDGTEKGYNKVFPESPLRVLEASTSTPALLSKTLGGKVTKKRAPARASAKK